jgi:hypothetical protein
MFTVYSIYSGEGAQVHGSYSTLSIPESSWRAWALERSWRLSEHWIKERKGYALFHIFIASPIKRFIARGGGTGLFKDPVFLPFSAGRHDRHVDVLIVDFFSKGMVAIRPRALLILLGDALFKRLHCFNSGGHTILLRLIQGSIKGLVRTGSPNLRLRERDGALLEPRRARKCDSSSSRGLKGGNVRNMRCFCDVSM